MRKISQPDANTKKYQEVEGLLQVVDQSRRELKITFPLSKN